MLGSHEFLPNLKNENQLFVEKKLETCIVIDGKRQKSGKRVRFAVDDNTEHIDRNGRIDESSFKHKDCKLNSKKLNEIETMENIKFQSKLLYSNRFSDNYLDHMGYPSKLRHCSFNRLNTNKCQQSISKCAVLDESTISKNIKCVQPKKENDIKLEGELQKAIVSHDHLMHENQTKNIEAKNNKDFEVINIINSIDQNNNNSNNLHSIPTYGYSMTSPTNFECDGSSGSRTYEDIHTTSLFNITMFKSNLDRVVRRYRMKQKKFEDDKLGK